MQIAFWCFYALTNENRSWTWMTNPTLYSRDPFQINWKNFTFIFSSIAQVVQRCIIFGTLHSCGAGRWLCSLLHSFLLCAIKILHVIVVIVWYRHKDTNSSRIKGACDSQHLEPTLCLPSSSPLYPSLCVCVESQASFNSWTVLHPLLIYCFHANNFTLGLIFLSSV